jgi:hypothetical protein
VVRKNLVSGGNSLCIEISINISFYFRGVCCLHPQGLIIALMVEASNTSETLVNFYQTIRRNNPEDSHIHIRRRENLKSCFSILNSVKIRSAFLELLMLADG